MTGGGEAPGLLRALGVLRERWWVVLVAGLVCMGAALAWSLTSEERYEASARLLFRDFGLEAAAGAGSSAPTLDPEGELATNQLLITTGEVAAQVKRQLATDRSVGELLEGVEVAAESGANIVAVTYTDTDPLFAARAANAFAAQFVEQRKRAARGKVGEGIELVRRQLDAAESEGEREQLREALQRLVVAQAVQTGDAEVVDRATVPTSPVAPNPARDAVIALFLGLAVGVAIAFLLNVLDRRLKTIDDIEAEFGLRALATVPERTRRPQSDRERAVALEPFRMLRGALGLLSPDRPLRVVLVTSGVPGEGKTSVAVGLARAIALAGQRVALVEADLRRPTFQAQFELGEDRRGLTTALVGGVPVTELLRTPLPGLRTLGVLPAGPLPPNAAELLRSAEMGRLLEDLADVTDVVVLDAPPLLPVADAQALLDHPQVDACLIVARAYATTREDARRERAIIERHRPERVGLVVNGLRGDGGGYDYYGGAGPGPAADGGRRERAGVAQR